MSDQPNPIVPYYVYDSTGEIIKTGTCPESMLDAQAPPGHTVAIGVARDDEQKVNPGTGELISKPPAPPAPPGLNERMPATVHEQLGLIWELLATAPGSRAAEVRQAMIDLKNEYFP